MTDIAARARQPQGTPVGGQFATEAKGEHEGELDAQMAHENLEAELDRIAEECDDDETRSKALVEALGMTATVKGGDLIESPWDKGRRRFMVHKWTVVLNNPHTDQPMKLPYYTGVMSPKEPTAAEVLSTLASDASGYANSGDFEDWCDEYGCNTDSRSDKKTYDQVGRQTAKLRELMGDHYELLLWGER